MLAEILGLWWLWIIIFGLYIRKSENPLLSDILIGVGVWYFLQYKIFVDIPFFTVSILLFSPLMAYIYFIFDSKKDIYVLESRFEGEELIYPSDGEKVRVSETVQNLYRFPYRVYAGFNHVGDLRPGFWNWGRIIFTDYIDIEKRIMFHPEESELHNISFNSARKVWLGIKDKLPSVILKNMRLTWLRDIDVVEQMDRTYRKTIFEFLAFNKLNTEPDDLLNMKRIGDRSNPVKLNVDKKTEAGKRGPIEEKVRNLIGDVSGGGPGD